MMNRRVDASAVASDVPRSRRQQLARGLARAFVGALGLNHATFLGTEIVQAIHPVASIPTRHGPFECRCGHGRLLWRAQTFHTEEPETIEWLDRLGPGDVLWDVGANVGLYAIYAARFMRCRVFAFEPESQNYALLVDNIALNDVGDRCFPACIPLTNRPGDGRFSAPYITKGGAYNLFEPTGTAGDVPESLRSVRTSGDGVVQQRMLASSIDDLVFAHGFDAPTHLKVDVDGLEPEIIAGAAETLARPGVRGILIELNRNSDRDRAIPDLLARHGFRAVSERSNWESRADRSREQDVPCVNVIFSRE